MDMWAKPKLSLYGKVVGNMFRLGDLFIRKLDPRGRLTLGADVLKESGISKDSLLQLQTEKGKIVISVIEKIEIRKGE